VQPAFSLDGNQSAVTDICQAVEGMPLGIELAATWLRAMPCQQIAGQIRRDLDFLTTPLRNVPERHRSLRAVFEHSWGLLSQVERDALMKLSVFRGGCDIEAAEQVAGASLWVLASLVDKSLVRINPSGRYEMHELLRQFAADKLLECNLAAETRHRHLRFFIGLAERLDLRVFGEQHVLSLDRLEIEKDNFRAVLDWALQVGKSEEGLQLAGGLGWFWYFRGYGIEGRDWLEKFQVGLESVSLSTKASALFHTFNLSGARGRLPELCEEALSLIQELGDQSVTAYLLTALGFWSPRRKERFDYLKEALALFKKQEDTWGICFALRTFARECFQQGDFARAGDLFEEGIRLARQTDDRSNLSWMLMLTACNKWYQGIIDEQTEAVYRECLALFRELHYKAGVDSVLFQLGKLAHLRGDVEEALKFYEQCLVLCQQIGPYYLVWCLIMLAQIFCSHREPERGARLLGAAEDLVPTFFAGPSFSEQEGRTDYERAIAAARARLSEVEFAAAFAEGQRMSLDRAIAYALDKGTYADAELDVISVKDSG
jgi:tetratricopeptide (TPR) repeat protein